MNIDVPAAVTEARKLVAAWDVFVAQVHGTKPEPDKKPIKTPRKYGRGPTSTKARILQYMNGDPVSTDALYKAFPDARRGTILTELQNLVKSQKLARVAYGVYQKVA